jgi:hypothetical protein
MIVGEGRGAVHCARLTGCTAMDSVNQLLLGVGGAEPVTLAGDVLFKTDLLTDLLHSLAERCVRAYRECANGQR